MDAFDSNHFSHLLEEAIRLIGGRWRLFLVHFLMDGRKRFTGLGRRSYLQNLEELDRWASISQSTDFDGLETSTFDHKLAELLENPRA